MKPILVFCTCPSLELAQLIGRTAVKQQLAACVSIISGIQSIYTWNEQLCEDTEFQLLIKTTQQRLPALQDLIHQLHSFDVPEIVATEITDGSASYLQWLSDQCS